MSIQSYTMNRFIRKTLYSLKRAYGSTVDIYKLGAASTNYKTGAKTVTKTMTRVERCIVLPVKVQRETMQGISQISAGKKFVYGGTFDAGTRLFIVDARDMTTDYEFNVDDWLVYNDRKYSIKDISEFEQNSAWVITGKEVLGVVPEQIIKLSVDHALDIDSEATETVV